LTDLSEQKITWPQWKAFLATFGGWSLDAMDWMFVALALPLIMREWKLDLPTTGLLGGATLIGVGCSSFFVGPFADRFGRVRSMMIAMFGYSILTGLCGLAQNFTQLFVLRIACGAFLGGEWGIGATLLNEYWPPKRRSRIMSTVQSGWAIGYGVASLLYVLIAPIYGWRVLFFLGVLPAFVAVLIMKYVPEPEAWVKADQERREIQKSLAAGQQVTKEQRQKVGLPLKALFGANLIRYTLLSLVVCTSITLAYWGAATWLPTFLATTKKLSIVRTGIYLFWLNVGAVAGYQLFGWLGDKNSRRFSLGVGFLASVAVVLIYINLNSPAAILFFGPVFGFITYGYWGLFGVVLSELFPTWCRATAVNFCFNAARGLGFFGPYLIGAFAKNHGLTAAIGLTSALYLVALVALIAMPEPRKVDEARTAELAAKAATNAAGKK
jgi:MFS family permease